MRAGRKHVAGSIAALCLMLASLALVAPPTDANETPQTTPAGDLYDVAMISDDDGWAVGEIENSTVALHWDGSRWERVETPNPGGYGGELTSVTAVATDDVWAVGRYEDPGYTRQLIEHWDGIEWSVVPGAELTSHNIYLEGVSAGGPDDVWAVGFVEAWLSRADLVPALGRQSVDSDADPRPQRDRQRTVGRRRSRQRPHLDCRQQRQRPSAHRPL